MKQIRLNMWTGNYLSKSFLAIRPDGAHAAGDIVEVYDDSQVFLGYAKVAATSKLPFEKISDTLSYQIIGKPAAYLKTVLHSMDATHMENGRVVNTVALQWTECNTTHMRMAMEIHWDRFIKAMPFSQDKMYQQQQLSLNI